MSKPLIIVESPTKARTITKFLGSEYIVEASVGHIRDLPKSKISIDVKNDFTPTYVIPPAKAEIVEKLKHLAAKASEIILATDADREGEAISWHLLEALGLNKKSAAHPHTIKRIVFHEITKPAIEEALKHPRDLDQNLVDAQQARRVLDRLVGYELSPFLWRKVRYGLSAGRVQSVAVRLVVEREREIQKFKTDEYWSIKALAENQAKFTFETRLHKVAEKNLGKLDITNQAQAEKYVGEMQKASWVVSSVQKKEAKRHPSAPFTTSTLQQEAARKLGFSAKQTMAVAQGLYEQGFITYMRTDSLNLSDSAIKQAKEIITGQFGNQYTLETPRIFTNKSKGAQEAHEAIRPTDLSKLPQHLSGDLDRNQSRLYDLIWKRTIACQMQQALVEQTTVDIEGKCTTENSPYTLRANGQIIKFDGFIRVYTEGKDAEDDTEEDGEKTLPDLKEGETISVTDITPEQHFTEPPPRYTDATLIKALEAAGIGRPSTYAPTLTTIQEREYVDKEEKKYKPTEVGIIVNDLLVEHFPEIVDLNFTARIEEEFDEIAEGKTKWVPVIREFYEPFKKHLIEKEAAVEKQVEESNVPCSHCGKMMIIKFGRAGRFLACPDPESKITQPLPEEAAKIKELEEKTKDERCPICDKPMEVKRGRFGFFLGCTDYPKCKGISKIWNKTGFKCPNCLENADRKNKPGDIVEKKGRGRAKPFWACTRWPDCEFIINVHPESEPQLKELFEAWKKAPKKDKDEKKSRYAKRPTTKKTAAKTKKDSGK